MFQPLTRILLNHPRMLGSVEFLADPLKIASRGRLSLCAYLIGAMGIWYAALDSSIHYTYLALEQIELEFPKSISLLIRIAPIIEPLCRTALAPIALTLLILPTRVIWRNDRLRWQELFSLAPRSIHFFIRSTVLGFRASFPLLVPGFAMAFLYVAFVASLQSSMMHHLYLLACIAVGALVLWKALPILLSPILSVAAALTPEEAVYLSRAILEHQRSRLFSITVITVGLIVLVSLVTSALHLPEWAHLAFTACVLWYGLTGAALITIQACIEYLRGMNPAQPKTQVQQSLIQPITAEITRVWVHQ